MSNISHTEDWTFNSDGLMEKRQMSGNNLKISESERFFADGMTDEEVDKVEISAKHWWMLRVVLILALATISNCEST